MRNSLLMVFFSRWMAAFAGVALVIALPNMALATSWPIFKAPDLAFLQNNSLIDTTDCPAGEGRLPKLVLNIREHFCRLFCPDAWEWALTDDGQCHPLANGFEFQGYDFEYFRSGDYGDEKLYTKVTARYGKANSSDSTFTFTFTSEKDNHWQCVEMSPEYHTVICANDM